jgi:hypothetical protein
MSDILRPEEAEWFQWVEEYFAERQEQQPDFPAPTMLAALKDGFFAEVRFDELNEMDKQLWVLFNRTHIPKPQVGDQLRILSLSWLAVTFRNTHSSFVLAESGFRDTSAANSRVALDHAIYLSLLATGQERDRISDRLGALYVKYLKSFGEGSSNSNPIMEEFIQLASEELPIVDPGPRTWSDIVEQVCKRLDTGDVVYSRYRILSNMMHPGLASSEPFVYSIKIDSSTNFRWTPIVNPANVIAFMAVASCVWAAWSVDHLLEQTYFGELLDPIAERLQLHRLFKTP